MVSLPIIGKVGLSVTSVVAGLTFLAILSNFVQKDAGTRLSGLVTPVIDFIASPFSGIGKGLTDLSIGLVDISAPIGEAGKQAGSFITSITSPFTAIYEMLMGYLPQVQTNTDEEKNTNVRIKDDVSDEAPNGEGTFTSLENLSEAYTRGLGKIYNSMFGGFGTTTDEDEQKTESFDYNLLMGMGK